VLVRQYFEGGYYPAGSPIASDAFHPSAALLKAVTINDAFAVARRRRVENNYLVKDDLPDTPNQYSVGTEMSSSNFSLTATCISNFQGFGRVIFGRGAWFQDQVDVHHKMIIPRTNSSGDPELKNAGEQHEYTFCVSHLYSKHPPRFTLVWTDYPASPLSAIALTNDLDLVVYSHSDRIVHHGMP
jgi:hypothetical protein